jgi:hypothetical protein
MQHLFKKQMIDISQNAALKRAQGRLNTKADPHRLPLRKQMPFFGSTFLGYHNADIYCIVANRGWYKKSAAVHKNGRWKTIFKGALENEKKCTVRIFAGPRHAVCKRCGL